MSSKAGGGGKTGLYHNLFVCVFGACVFRYQSLEDRREEPQGDVRQWREREHRNNGVRESTSEEDEKSSQSIQLGVYQLCMASILLFWGHRRRRRGQV